MTGLLQRVFIRVVTWWRFRKVRLKSEGVGCQYRWMKSIFVSSERLSLATMFTSVRVP